MKTIKFYLSSIIAFCLLSTSLEAVATTSPVSCANLVNQTIPAPEYNYQVKITSASVIPAGGGLPQHCQVEGNIKKNNDPNNNIGFQMRLPTNWNGKFMMHGTTAWGGVYGNYFDCGLSGDLKLDSAIQRGYAEAVTDNGHKAIGGSSLDPSWIPDNPNSETMTNYLHKAVHLVTVASKEIIKKHYAKSAKYAYFAGCSTGGRQGLWAATTYPHDYEGILAGFPEVGGNDFGEWAIQLQIANFPTPSNFANAVVNTPILQSVSQIIYAICDGQDGKTDGLLSDPLDCHINFDQALAPLNLTSAQKAVIKKLYTPITLVSGKVYRPFPLGAEKYMGPTYFLDEGILAFIGYPNVYYFTEITFDRLLVLHNPTGQLSQVNFNSNDWKKWDILKPNTDLIRFWLAGGKIILYHSYADGVLSANDTISYLNEALYDHPLWRLVANFFAKFYIVPNANHCGDGATFEDLLLGTNPTMAADFLTPLENWVEKGIMPRKIDLKVGTNPQIPTTVCPYPKELKTIGGIKICIPED